MAFEGVPRILVDGEFDIKLVGGMFEAAVHSGDMRWVYCYTPHQALSTYNRLGGLLEDFFDERNVKWIR